VPKSVRHFAMSANFCRVSGLDWVCVLGRPRLRVLDTRAVAAASGRYLQSVVYKRRRTQQPLSEQYRTLLDGAYM